MALWKHVGRRAAFALLATYLVLSVTFGFVALTPDPAIGRVAYAAGHSVEAQKANASERAEIVQEAIREYKRKHGLDDPVHVRYARWMTNIVTLDWGRSETQDAPVTAVLARTIPNTLAYLVPAMLFALIGGIGIGVYSALDPGSLLERIATVGFYFGYGVPNYWLALFLLMVGVESYVGGLFGARMVHTVVLPAAILGTSLLAGQLRYARAESREYVNTEFLKLVRAKGASNRLLARHVLRNAAIPLFSLFFADLLGVLVVEVFVLESPFVFGIHGVGGVGLEAVRDRDLPLILGVALVFAFAGIVGNLVQDLAYLVFDPRVDAD